MAVRVTINTRDMQLTDRLESYVEKKVEKLDRYLDVLDEANVELKYVKSARSAQDRNVAQLTVRGKGVLLRAEERTDDMFASMDAVLDKIYRQIERYKGKHWKGRGDGRTAAQVAPEPVEEDEDILNEPAIIRRKRMQLSPMDEQEAIEQMSLLDHEEFFLFLNSSTNQVNVLYRRRDSSLGLIETDIL
jgi:putative sigma-54 modulation protein